MRHCACSGSALSAFIKSLAGLELHQPQSFKAHNTGRSINALKHGRQQRSNNVLCQRSYSAQTATPRHGTTLPDSSISANTIADASPTHSRPATVGPGKDEQAGVTNNEQPGQHDSQAISTQSRQESRLARKARRMAAGAYQPQTQAKLAAAKEERAAKRATIKTAMESISSESKTRSQTTRKPHPDTSSNVTESGFEGKADSPRVTEVKARSKRRETGNQEDSIVQSILKEVEQDKAPKVPRSSWEDKQALSKHEASNKLPGDPEDGTSEHSRRGGQAVWGVQKDAIKEKLGGAAWNPRKRLSPDSLNGIRALHESDPMIYTTPVLAQHFRVTPDAIRRILKSKWRPSETEIEDRRQRWEKRGADRRAGIEAQKTRSRNARHIKEILNPVNI